MDGKLLKHKGYALLGQTIVYETHISLVKINKGYLMTQRPKTEHTVMFCVISSLRGSLHTLFGRPCSAVESIMLIRISMMALSFVSCLDKHMVTCVVMRHTLPNTH